MSNVERRSLACSSNAIWCGRGVHPRRANQPEKGGGRTAASRDGRERLGLRRRVFVIGPA
jgi:hypothetical protein